MWWRGEREDLRRRTRPHPSSTGSKRTSDKAETANNRPNGTPSTWGVVRFAAIMIGSFALMAIAYLTLHDSPLIKPFLDANARSAVLFVNLFGGSVHSSGPIIWDGGRSYEIVMACTSFVPTAILLCAVVAWRSSLGEKVIGLAVGVPALYFLNLVRILSLLYIGSTFPQFMDIAHFVIWQILLILATAAIWMLWATRLVRVRVSGQLDESS